MRETIKQKNLRLEAEIKNLKAKNDKQYDRIIALQNQKDDDFAESPLYKQMQQDLFLKNQSLESYKHRLQMSEKIRSKQIDTIESLQKLIDESNMKNIHNARGAGRKPKLSADEVASIKEMRASGATVKEIAAKYSCSLGLVSKVINS